MTEVVTVHLEQLERCIRVAFAANVPVVCVATDVRRWILGDLESAGLRQVVDRAAGGGGPALAALRRAVDPA